MTANAWHQLLVLTAQYGVVVFAIFVAAYHLGCWPNKDSAPVTPLGEATDADYTNPTRRKA